MVWSASIVDAVILALLARMIRGHDIHPSFWPKTQANSAGNLTMAKSRRCSEEENAECGRCRAAGGTEFPRQSTPRANVRCLRESAVNQKGIGSSIVWRAKYPESELSGRPVNSPTAGLAIKSQFCGKAVSLLPGYRSCRSHRNGLPSPSGETFSFSPTSGRF
jgi:hypothetical protein